MMTRNLNIVMMGLKEMESVSSMPLMGSHLCKHANNDDEEDNGYLGLQSCFQCIPIKCVLGRESEEFLKLSFMKKYHSILETEKPNDIGQNTWFPDWKPFKVLCLADQKLTWNTVQKGGATKSMEHFCTYCVI